MLAAGQVVQTEPGASSCAARGAPQHLVDGLRRPARGYLGGSLSKGQVHGPIHAHVDGQQIPSSLLCNTTCLALDSFSLLARILHMGTTPYSSCQTCSFLPQATHRHTQATVHPSSGRYPSKSDFSRTFSKTSSLQLDLGMPLYLYALGLSNKCSLQRVRPALSPYCQVQHWALHLLCTLQACTTLIATGDPQYQCISTFEFSPCPSSCLPLSLQG